jgi:hypothetical protein
MPDCGGASLMPWVYALTLTDYTDPGQIQTDWKENIPGNASVQNDHGGVTVSGTKAVIVSTRNNPDFTAMENLSYVSTISESKEIPSRGTSDFDPPIDLGNGIQLME